MKTFFSILVLLAAPNLFACAADTRERPNIVFILVDDMGWRDLASYGHAFHETPVIDELAGQGMRFTSFYAATPVCSSTRSTILTGQYSARTGMTDFIPGYVRPFAKLLTPLSEQNLKDGVKTSGDVLKSDGYVTGHFGRWHVGNDEAHQPPSHGYEFTEEQLGEEFDSWRSSARPGPRKIDFLTDAALWFIEENRHKPFFLTVSHYAVHIPLEANGSTIAKYRRKKKPTEGVNHPVYAAMTEDLDTSVGRILDKLDELRLAQSTIVVFASDNGGLLQSRSVRRGPISTNAPLRGGKGELYEGGIRVPLIVRWPGVVAPGTISDEPTTTADLLPTFCEMTGAVPPDQPIDGVSMVKILNGTERSLHRDAIYFHYPHYHHSTPAGAIRVGDMKLIEFFEDGRLELYNLRDDIGEARDLAAQYPDRAKALHARLAKWRQETGARMPAANSGFDPERATRQVIRRVDVDIPILDRPS